MLNIIEISIYITERLERSMERHDIRSFVSGYKMIDIWVYNNFYCIQIKNGFIRVNLVTMETGLSNVPEHSFKSMVEFKYEPEKFYRSLEILLIEIINGSGLLIF